MNWKKSITTVMLVDDHPTLRGGLKYLLDGTDTIRVVAEASTGESAIELYRLHKPHIVILDINIPGAGGLDAARRLCALDDSVKILMFTMHDNEIMVQRSLEAGAKGYLSKQNDLNQVIVAIHAMTEGKVYIDPQHAAKLLQSQLYFASPNPLHSLTPREFQIFKLLAEGLSVNELSNVLHISSKTVGVHHTSIMRKLDVKNISQLVRLAVRTGVIEI